MLTGYLFNTRQNQHFFGKICGVRPFGVGNDTRRRISRTYDGMNVYADPDRRRSWLL